LTDTELSARLLIHRESILLFDFDFLALYAIFLDVGAGLELGCGGANETVVPVHVLADEGFGEFEVTVVAGGVELAVYTHVQLGQEGVLRVERHWKTKVLKVERERIESERRRPPSLTRGERRRELEKAERAWVVALWRYEKMRK